MKRLTLLVFLGGCLAGCTSGHVGWTSQCKAPGEGGTKLTGTADIDYHHEDTVRGIKQTFEVVGAIIVDPIVGIVGMFTPGT